ncbi:MAG: hypothetical protein Q9183_000171 [Haloplaca sp. 2 TL-2023]
MSDLGTEEPQPSPAAHMSASGQQNVSPRKLIIPPPPRTGQRMEPPEFYTVTQATSPQRGQQPRIYPIQRSPISPRSSLGEPLHEWSTRYSNETQVASNHSRVQSFTEDIRRGSYEHPPGYIQNPYASEMTAAQRFAVEQEDQVDRGLPLPGCTHSRKPSTASIILEDSVASLRRFPEVVAERLQDWLSKTF